MPQRRIIRMGCILNKRVPIKAKQNIVTLTINTNVLSLGLPKSSVVISMTAAAARRPTMVGRRTEQSENLCV